MYEEAVRTVMHFLQDALGELDNGALRVKEETRPSAIGGHSGFPQTTAYEFAFREQQIRVDVKERTVTINGDLLVLGRIKPDLYKRLEYACAECFIMQQADENAQEREVREQEELNELRRAFQEVAEKLKGGK